MSTHWYDHLLFAFLGIIIPLMSFRSKIEQDKGDVELDLPPKKHLYLNNMFILGIGMLLCLTAWNAGNNDWELLGFTKMENSYFAWMAMVVLVFLYLVDGLFTYFQKRNSAEYFNNMKDIIPLNWQEYRTFVPVAIMAGISEEIIFRGYLFHYLISFLPDMSSAPFFAILITSFGFSLSHLYQGWFAVAKIFMISLLFGLVYLYSKSLIGVIAIHIGIDLISGMSGIFMKDKLVFSEENEAENS